MAVAIAPGDAYQLLSLIAELGLTAALAERTVAQTARLALEPEDTPAGRQLAALHRLSEQLLPLAFTEQGRPLTIDGDPPVVHVAASPLQKRDASPNAGVDAHRHPGLLPSECPKCRERLTAAGVR